MHTVKMWRSDEASESGIALMEEHEFADFADATECARRLEGTGAGLVTFNADPAPCTGCGTPTDRLAVFPGGVCLACWAQSPEGRRTPTADEVAGMWGGPARRRRR